MRIPKRITDLANQLDAGADGQSLLIRVPGDGLAFDVLHHEIRKAIVGAATIEQAHDVAMLERREDLTLVAEPGDRLGRADRAGQDLDGDAVNELLIIAYRQVHGTHAALAELPGQT